MCGGWALPQLPPHPFPSQHFLTHSLHSFALISADFFPRLYKYSQHSEYTSLTHAHSDHSYHSVSIAYIFWGVLESGPLFCVGRRACCVNQRYKRERLDEAKTRAGLVKSSVLLS